MGYTTDFEGRFNVTPTLLPDHREYLIQFANTRRMKRDAAIAETLPDPVRKSVGLPIGHEGAYYVGSDSYDSSVIDNNCAPGAPSWSNSASYEERKKLEQDGIAAGTTQPGLWCQWIPTEDGEAIEWDGGEKFYNYVEWLEYLIHHFLAPWGYMLNGEVTWQGEDSADMGTIYVKDNVIEAVASEITNPGPSWQRASVAH